MLPSDTKHYFLFTIQFLHFLALEQILLRTAIYSVLGHGCVDRLSHNLSAAPPDSSQGRCSYDRSLHTSKGQLPPHLQHFPSQGLMTARAGAEHQDTSTLRSSSKCLSIVLTTVRVWRPARLPLMDENTILQKILKKTCSRKASCFDDCDNTLSIQKTLGWSLFAETPELDKALNSETSMSPTVWWRRLLLWCSVNQGNKISGIRHRNEAVEVAWEMEQSVV